MGENAFVTWAVDPTPWKAEEQSIRQVCLPLDLKLDDAHPIRAVLPTIRRRARARARELPGMRGKRC